MPSTVRTRITRIGNSKGIRIPKAWLEQSGMPEEVLMVVEAGKLTIQPAFPPRHGWEERFRNAIDGREEGLLDPPLPTRFDAEEWAW